MKTTCVTLEYCHRILKEIGYKPKKILPETEEEYSGFDLELEDNLCEFWDMNEGYIHFGCSNLDKTIKSKRDILSIMSNIDKKVTRKQKLKKLNKISDEEMG